MDFALSRNIIHKDAAIWHQRFLQQAGWGRELRYHLYRMVTLARRREILELGCGTGVIAAEIAGRTKARVTAIDTDARMIDFARRSSRGLNIDWRTADAERLPFGSGSFDLIVTHYFWLWAKQPAAVVRECRRVLKPGGVLAALAEPDYGQRTDRPGELSAITQLLEQDLRSQGADTRIGPKLERLLARAGFAVTAGAAFGAWDHGRHREEFDGEWQFIESVLQPGPEVARLKELERAAIEGHTRESVTPVFWAVGKKQGRV